MRWFARLSTLLLGVVVGGLAVAVPAGAVGIPGVVQVSPGSSLNVRSGPSTSYPVLGRLGSGARVALACQQSGQVIAGTVRTTAQWDRLADGDYIADAFLTRPDVPSCTLGAAANVSTALNRRSNTSTLLAPVGLVAPHGSLTISCQLAGESIVGSSGTTDLWDRLADGSFVADAFVSWPHGRPAVPWCVLSGPVPPGAGADFVTWAAPFARASMKAYRVPASVTLAQAILESGWGRSGLTVSGNAYFGMKCFGSPGSLATGCRPFSTSECSTVCGPTVASFRLYASITQSFNDHGSALSTLDRYRTAMQFVGDPDRFAQELQRAGYATSPTYADNLITLMHTYNLYQYDQNLV